MEPFLYFELSVFLTIPHYSRVGARGEPSRAKTMGLCVGVACKLSFWSECLSKTQATIRAPKTALNLFVSVPRSSDLTSRSTQCHYLSLQAAQKGLRGEAREKSILRLSLRTGSPQPFGVGWVERSDTHRLFTLWRGDFAQRSI